MNDKSRQLAEKLLQLARRGVGGERENAENALLRHLNKHGLTLEEFESQNKTVAIEIPWIKGDQSGRNAFYVQIVSSVIGLRRVEQYEHWGNGLGEIVARFYGTLSEKIEVEAKIDIYWNDYQEQLSIFRSAYIQKNELYALPSKNDKGREMSEEESRKLSKMMDSVDRKEFRKQLQAP